MLEFQNVSYQYPSEDFDIIDHLSFAVEPGSFHCIIGISGCGKSTIFRMTNGLLKPKAGTILVEGKSIVGRKHYCGYMPQKDLLFPWRTVGENVALPLEIQGELTRAERRGRAEAALADVGLAGCGSKMPDELSGGMRQRAAFARTMLTGCDLLLLDEPFSALDSYLKYQLELELAETLGGFPGTVLWVSHDRGEVFRNCRRVCVIDRGRSQPVTTLGELFRSPGTEAAARLSGCKNYADARPREDAVFLPDWGLTLSCGRPVPEGVCRIGIRAHHVQLAGPGAENAFSCTAVKVVEDVFSTIVLLRPEGAAPEAPLLRMELDKDNWQAVPDKDRLTVSVPPEAILLLES